MALSYNDVANGAWVGAFPNWELQTNLDFDYVVGDYLFAVVMFNFNEGSTGAIVPPGDWVESGRFEWDDAATIPSPLHRSVWWGYRKWLVTDDHSTYIAAWTSTDNPAIVGSSGAGARVSSMDADPLAFFDGQPAPTGTFDYVVPGTEGSTFSLGATTSPVTTTSIGTWHLTGDIGIGGIALSMCNFDDSGIVPGASSFTSPLHVWWAYHETGSGGQDGVIAYQWVPGAPPGEGPIRILRIS